MLEQEFKDRNYMEMAIERAHFANKNNFLPVGAVLVVDDVDKMMNWRGEGKLDHAEMLIAQRIAQNYKVYRNKHTTLYVTLEPCTMCLGALALLRVNRIVYALEDGFGGDLKHDPSSKTPMFARNKISFTSGVMREEALKIFRNFFSRQPINSFWWTNNELSLTVLGQCFSNLKSGLIDFAESN